MTLTQRLEISDALRSQGYNCAQCVLAAFEDVTALPREQALRLATGLGGGVGGSGHICGVISAIACAHGMLTEGLPADKQAVYRDVNRLAKAFEERYGSCDCCVLKAPGASISCKELIRAGIEMYHNFLKEHADA